MKKEVLEKVFNYYPIDNVLLLEDETSCVFIISGMKESISVEKWNYLENILTVLTKKEVTFIVKNQADKYLKNDAKKGVVIR